MLGEIMMSVYPDDMGDYVPTFEDAEAVFSDMGYYLSMEVYEILCNMEDPSMLNQTEWDYLYQSFNTQDQSMIMGELDSIFMALYP